MRTDVKVGVVISLFIVLIAGWYYMDGDRHEEPISLEGSAITDGGEAVQSKAAPAGKPATNKQRHLADAKRSAAKPKRTTTKSNRASPASVNKNPQHTARGDQKRNASASDKVTYQRPHPSAGQTKTPRISEKSSGLRQRSAQSSDSTNGLSHAVTQKGDVNVAGGSSKDKSQAPTKLATADKRGIDRRPESTAKGTPINIGRQARAKTAPRVKAPRTTLEAAAVDLHRVQKGDTIAALSRMYYGDEKYTQFLIEQNPAIANPSQLRVGVTVRIPALSSDGALRAADVSVVTATDKSTRSGDRTSYTVKSGDTFYGIARKKLGNAGRWREIYELNKSHVGGDPSRLKVGQVLILPRS